MQAQIAECDKELKAAEDKHEEDTNPLYGRMSDAKRGIRTAEEGRRYLSETCLDNDLLTALAEVTQRQRAANNRRCELGGEWTIQDTIRIYSIQSIMDVLFGGLCRRTASDIAATAGSLARRNIGLTLRLKSSADACYAAESTTNKTTNLEEWSRVADGLRMMPPR